MTTIEIINKRNKIKINRRTMSEHGAVLQTYTQELVKYIEYLKNEREDLDCRMDEEEIKKKDVIDKIKEHNLNLEIITKNLDQIYKKRNHCDKAIADAEIGLLKIIESSQVLLSFMKQETEILKS